MTMCATTLLAIATLATLSLIPSAIAHGGVLSYNIDGEIYNGWAPYNSPDGQSTIQRPNPILDATDPTLACNDDGTSPTGQLTANSVLAGSKITAYWNNPWPHPYGPMLVYLAQCPGSTCTGVNANDLSWFKIDESGLISGTIGDGYWGSGKMIDQNSTWTTTIPSSVPSGNYLIRFETIALHSLPAQFYPECAQIQITGGGSLAPSSAELVKFPGAYSNTDPGLTVDLYTNEAQTETTYVIPGPPLYGSGDSSGSSGSSPASTPSSTVATISSTEPASTPTGGSSSSGAAAAQWAQCGGIGWTGATTW
ncbi:Esterase/lipase/thioesterase [Stygiomarasmius scandens]|uniref:lytic cellulose monooxygenase (C4-dehydrogenating) n=1 Tax=Marasmiellus scandens TaxID=2682957 RepID=A0ABR1JQR8_9AGAR